MTNLVLLNGNRIRIMKTYLYIFIAFLLCGFTACSDVEYASVPEVAKISNLQYALNGRNVTLTWTLPASSEDRKSTRLNSSHTDSSRMPSSA